MRFWGAILGVVGHVLGKKKQKKKELLAFMVGVIAIGELEGKYNKVGQLEGKKK